MKNQNKPKANPSLISYVTKGYIPRVAIWLIGLLFLFMFLIILFS